MVVVPASGIIFVLLATFKIWLVRRKTVPNASENNSNDIGNNIKSYNKDTFNIGLFILLLIVAALCVPLYYLGHQSGTLTIDLTSINHHLMSYLVSDIGHEATFMIVLPLVGYAGNQDLRSFVFNLVKSQFQTCFY